MSHRPGRNSASPARCLALVALLVASAAGAAQAPQASIWASKPDVDAFDRRIDQHLENARASIREVLAVEGARTLDNTLQPFDEAILNLNEATDLSWVMENLHPDRSFRDRASAAGVRVAAVRSDIQIDPSVYRALSELDTKEADAGTRHYVNRQLLLARLAGVDKDDRTRIGIKSLTTRLAELSSTFQRNISEDVRYVTATAAELDGLPEDFIATHAPDKDGNVRISTSSTEIFPLLTYATSGELRRRAVVAYSNRGYPQNAAVLREMLLARERLATLLGYANWADYFATDKMAGSGARIAEFIASVDAVARPAAARDYAALLAEKRKSQPSATEVSVDEYPYLRELVRRTQFEFDSQSVRPYFPYERVKRGILDVTAALFRVSFEREPDAPAWHPTVETWLVRDRGEVIGRIYLDMHPREGKYSHVAMSSLRDGVAGRQFPEGVLLCNFPAPTATDPGLMGHGQVQVFFHEFGHLMHHILAGRQRWAGTSGVFSGNALESDFVEAPSQLLEELMRSPAVLATFARHYQTNESIPAALVAQMNRSKTFGRGLYTGMDLAMTAMSFELHRRPAAGTDPDALWDKLHAQHFGVPLVPGTHGWANFVHLAGYSSAYYTYLWDAVIALDFYRQFDAMRPLDGDSGMRYRRTVLEPGATQSANDLVRNFLGRPPDPAVLKAWIEEGLASAP